MSDEDERILNMRINNKAFLKGAADSGRALDTLNKGIDSAGKGKGLSSFGSGIDAVKSKFGVLQIAGVTALATITSRAVSSGINLIKSLTISPIMDGYREYNKLLTSTQTISANTGLVGKKGIAEVGKYLNNLNKYSDQTIYNFGQMADSIGRFTTAGVKIDVATNAIKGLSTAAALSGSTTEQLNTAMYQVSQALSTGTIKLQDWNSLNNAGLGGKNIQYSIRETAKVINGSSKVVDAAIGKYGSFRESLRTGWLTTDIFTKSMKLFAGQSLDATSKTKDLQKLGLEPMTIKAIQAGKAIKDFSPKEIQNLTEKGFKPADISALKMGNTVAYTVKQLQGMGYSKEAATKLAQLGKSALESATKVKTFSQLMDVLKEAVGSGFAGVFQQLFGNLQESGKLWTKVGNVISGAIQKFFNSMQIALQTWHNLKDTQTGMNGYQLAWAAIGNIFKSVGNILRPFIILIQSMLPATGDAGTGAFKLTKILYDLSVYLETVTSKITTLDPVFKAIGVVIKFVAGVVVGYVKSLIDLFQILSPIGTAIGGLVVALVKLGASLLHINTGKINLGSIFDGLLDARRAILEPLVKTISAVIDAVTKLVNTGDFGAFKKNFAAAFSNLSPFKGMFEKGKQAAADIVNGIKAGWQSGDIQATISSWVNNMLDFFKGLLGINSPSTVFREYGKNIVEGLAQGIAGAFGAAKAAIGALVKSIMSGIGGIDRFDLVNLFSVLFSGAVLLTVYKFIKSLTEVFDHFGGLFKNVNGVLTSTTGTLKTMQTGIKAKAILDIAIAVGILAASMFVLSKIPANKLAISMAVVLVLLKQLSSLMVLLGKTSALSVKGIATVTAMGAALILMSIAILLLSGAVAIFAKMKTSTLVKGLIAISAILLILAGASYLLGKAAPSMILAAAGVLVLSIALAALAPVIVLYSKFKWSTIFNGMLKMAAALLILGIAMIPLSLLGAQLLIASVALVVLSVALTALAGTLVLYAGIKWSTIISGALKIGAALVILGVAGLLAAPGLIALGVAALAIGTGLLLAGVGLTLFGAGLAVVVAAGSAGIALLGAAIITFISLLPLIGTQFIAAIKVILENLAKASPSIIDSLVKIGTEILRGLVELSPKIVSATVKIVQDLLAGLVDLTPSVIQAGVNLLIALLNGITENSDKIVTAAGDAIVSLLAALNLAVVTYLPEIIRLGKSIARNVLAGLYEGLVPDKAKDAIRKIGNALILAFKALLGIASPSTVFAGFGRNIIQGLINGIARGVGAVVGAVISLGRSIIGNIASIPGKARAALGSLSGFLRERFSSAFSSAKAIVSSGVKTVTEYVSKLPGAIRGFASSAGAAARGIGTAIASGIKNGISGAVSFVLDRIGSLKRIVGGAINGLASKAKSLHLPGFAKGVTGFGGGTAIVGERGAELVSMGRGSNVVTNETLAKFMKQVVRLTSVLGSGGNPGYSSSGSAQISLSANIGGDPKSSGLQFAANLAAGLVQGLKANQTPVNNAMSGVGNSVMDTFTDLLGIRSPSTVYKKYAGFLAQGFINGLVASIESVKKASTLMGEAAVLAIANTISDGQKKLEIVRGQANAYSNAAAVTRSKANATRNASEKKRLLAQAAYLDRAAKNYNLRAKKQADAVKKENDAKARAEAYANADTQGKADMKQEDALKQAQAATKAREKAISLQKEADLLRRTDSRTANKLAKAAKAALAQSKSLASKSESFAQEAYDLNLQAKTEIDAIQQAQILSVSADDVAFAQSQFDAYAKQMADAQQAAIDANSQPAGDITFEQNNYSPEAISPSDAYRNGKSLIAVAQRQLLPS